MKKVIQIVLAVVIVFLAFVVYRQLTIPLKFQKEVETRSAAVIDRIKDIRTAERAYKQVNQVYTGNFDSLINFVLNDSMVYEKAFGSADDSVAVARGLVSRETFKVAVIDTIFGSKQMTPEKVEMIRYIPYTDGMEFILEAGQLKTESGVTVQVFECRSLQGIPCRPQPTGAHQPDRRKGEYLQRLSGYQGGFDDQCDQRCG